MTASKEARELARGIVATVGMTDAEFKKAWGELVELASVVLIEDAEAASE